MRLALVVALVASFLSATVRAAGPYERRRAKRGEITDTSAKLGTYAFIEDTEANRWRLAMFVDAVGFRDPLVPDLVPVRVGVAHRGRGETLRLDPRRFRLDWDGAETSLTALTQGEVLAHPMGRAALRHAGLALRARHAPVAFDARDGLQVPTRFHADPAAGVFLNDATGLPPGAWFTDVLFFRLPEGLDPWSARFQLRFVTGPVAEPEHEEVAVSTCFRVEEDPQLHRRAFRRARKALKQENKAARRAEKRAAQGDGSSR
jgi:hypothetical protein